MSGHEHHWGNRKTSSDTFLEILNPFVYFKYARKPVLRMECSEWILQYDLMFCSYSFKMKLFVKAQLVTIIWLGDGATDDGDGTCEESDDPIVIINDTPHLPPPPPPSMECDKCRGVVVSYITDLQSGQSAKHLWREVREGTGWSVLYITFPASEHPLNPRSPLILSSMTKERKPVSSKSTIFLD